MSSDSFLNINSVEYDKSGRSGMCGHTPVHRLVFVRHGETQANNALMENKDIDHITLDTALTSTGILQGEEVAKLFETIGFKPDNIYCSCLSRAYITAYPTISLFKEANLVVNSDWREFNGKKNEVIFDQVNSIEWEYIKETHEEFSKRVSNEFDKLKLIGTRDKPVQSIIFTHSQVIATILLKCITNNSSCFDSVLFHISNGSITCIDIDECQNVHIHAVNYTQHLSKPTGHHTPFI